MHREVRVLSRAALCCAVWLFSIAVVLPAQGQEEGNAGPVIAVIDMQKILRESLAVSQMQQQIDGLRQAYQVEFREKEAELRANDQELARQRNNLPADTFAEKRQEMERKVAEVQRSAQQRRRNLDSLFGQGMGQVRSALVGIVNEIATEQNIDLVLAKSTVIAVKQELDITNEVLARLDANLPRVELPTPQN